MAHFLQSPAWAAFQESLGRTTMRDSGNGWSYLAILEVGRFNTRLYCPYGPEVASPEALDAALASLIALAAKHKVTFIRIEPTGTVSRDDLLARHLAYVSYNQLQPEHTQCIDLTLTRDQIVAQMQQNTRNIYRNYHKKGVSIHTSTTPADISYFTALMHKVADRNGIKAHGDAYYRMQAEALFPLGAATLYYAKFEDRIIAAAIAYDSLDTRYYAHAATDDDYRKLSAGTALLGQMITDAKDKHLTTFDLYGIAPNNDPSHPWAGFTKFKKSFGGSEHTYVGTWDLPISKLTYLAYRSYQRLSHRQG